MELSAIAAFDTLATAHALEEAGFERKQAEIIASALRQAVEADRDRHATKADLAATKADLKAEFAALKAEMLKIAIGAAAAIVLANAGLTVALIELLR